MINKVLRLARMLSLDIVLGAVVSSMFLADYLEVQLPCLFVLALALSVWMIYTIDHLSDAYSIPHTAHTFRHQFHQKYFKILCMLIVLVSVLSIILLIQLPLKLIVWGGVVLMLVGVYFVSIRWMNLQYILHKEFVIAILYAVGIFLAPIYIKGLPPTPSVWLLFVQYVLLALCNLLLFSWYEKELDQLDFHVSFSTVVGDKITVNIIKTCLWLLYSIIGFGIMLYFSNGQFIFTQIIILCMLITLHCIYLFPDYFRRHDRYRSLADAIFLYPLFYLVF